MRIIALLTMVLLCAGAQGAPAGRAEMPMPTPNQGPERLVLEFVPRVGYDLRLCPFAGCLESCLKYLGEEVDYDLLMTVSGAAFRRLWKREDGANVAVCYVSLEPARRAMAAYGYEMERVPLDRVAMIAAVRRHLAEKRPLIGFDVLAGPPEPCVIAGYDDRGETLVGWSYFQPEPAKYCEKRGWTTSCDYGFLAFGKRIPRLEGRELVVSTLHYALDMERQSRRIARPEHASGLAAYDGWASALEDDAHFPADNPQAMENRGMVHCDQLAMLHERGSAAAGLRRLAGMAPEAGEAMRSAADHYQQVGEYAGKMPFETMAEDLKSPARRRELARLVREAKGIEERAVGELEKALDTFDPIPERAALVTPAPADLTRGARWQVENLPLAIGFRALANMLGIDTGREVNAGGWSTDFAYVQSLATSGGAFEFGLYVLKDGGRHEVFRRFPAEAYVEPCRRSLEALRLEGEVLAPAGDAARRDALRKAVAHTLGRTRRPVLLVGLPSPEHVALITAYDEGGAVLHGWSCEGGGPPVLFEGEKRRTFADWEAKVDVAVLPREPLGYPEDARVYRQALRQAVQLLRRSEDGGYVTGPALCDAWASFFAGAEGEEGLKRVQGLIDPYVWDLAERRHYARVFLDKVVEVLPAASEPLKGAAKEFGAIHDLMWEISRAAGAPTPGDPTPKLSDPAARQKIAGLIRKAKAHDARAADLLEDALAR